MNDAESRSDTERRADTFTLIALAVALTCAIGGVIIELVFS